MTTRTYKNIMLACAWLNIASALLCFVYYTFAPDATGQTILPGLVNLVLFIFYAFLAEKG